MLQKTDHSNIKETVLPIYSFRLCNQPRKLLWASSLLDVAQHGLEAVLVLDLLLLRLPQSGRLGCCWNKGPNYVAQLSLQN